MILVSAIYWVQSLCRWPWKLVAIAKAERLATMRNKKLSFSARVLDAINEFSWYPNVIAAVPTFFFAFTHLYIVSWRLAIDTVERERSKLSTTQLEKDPNKLVIRYRQFASTERWIRHRLTSNSASRIKNGAIALASMILFGSALTFIVALLLGHNIHWIASMFQSDSAGSIASHGNNAFYNALVLKTVGLCGILSLIFAAIVYRRQPTHYEFTPKGFRSFRWHQTRWRRARRVPGELVLWSQVVQVGLSRRSQRTRVNDLEIEFKLTDGNQVRLKLGSIESIEDREAVLHAIGRWAPHVSRDAELVQALLTARRSQLHRALVAGSHGTSSPRQIEPAD